MSQFPTIQQIVLSENGNQDFQPRDTVTIMVDPQEIPLLNGKDTYLRFNVKLSGDFKAQLDRAGGGGHAIVQTVSIWNGTGSTLLEQLNDVPIWVGAKNYYDNTEGLENQRNLLEGLPPVSALSLQSQYFKNPPADLHAVVDWTSVECCLPIYQSGILYGDSACPVAALGGLMIKIQLADAQKAIRSIGCAGFISDRLGNGAALEATGQVALNMPFNKTSVPPAGEPTADQSLPVCYELLTAIGAGAAHTTVTVRTVGAGVPAAPANIRANANAPTVEADFPFVVGETLGYLADTGLIVNCGPITAITYAAPTYTLTVAGFTVAAGDVATGAASHNPVFVQLANVAGVGAGPAGGAASNAQTASYTVSDVELVTSVVQPDPRYFSAMMSAMKSGGGYSWDIRTFNLYRNNLMKSIAASQELIPCTEFRARGLLMAQINPTTSWTTSWSTPMSDYMRNYQYVMGNVNTPLLPVVVDREFDRGSNAWNATADEERLKALEASKVTIRSELHPSACFLTGREVAKRGYSANLNDISVRYNQSWGVVDGVAGTVSPQHNKILDTFVSHFRKITARPDNVVVSF